MQTCSLNLFASQDVHSGGPLENMRKSFECAGSKIGCVCPCLSEVTDNGFCATGKRILRLQSCGESRQSHDMQDETTVYPLSLEVGASKSSKKLVAALNSSKGSQQNAWRTFRRGSEIGAADTSVEVEPFLGSP